MDTPATSISPADIQRVYDRVAPRLRAEILYWQTEEFNGTARRLYERVARRSPFVAHANGSERMKKESETAKSFRSRGLRSNPHIHWVCANRVPRLPLSAPFRIVSSLFSELQTTTARTCLGDAGSIDVHMPIANLLPDCGRNDRASAKLRGIESGEKKDETVCKQDAITAETK